VWVCLLWGFSGSCGVVRSGVVVRPFPPVRPVRKTLTELNYFFTAKNCELKLTSCSGLEENCTEKTTVKTFEA
jgi:hypothetical protein